MEEHMSASGFGPLDLPRYPMSRPEMDEALLETIRRTIFAMVCSVARYARRRQSRLNPIM